MDLMHTFSMTYLAVFTALVPTCVILALVSSTRRYKRASTVDRYTLMLTAWALLTFIVFLYFNNKTAM